MQRKTAQLQIRVTPEQKRVLKRLARDAGVDMSTFVLGRILPDEGERFQEALRRLTAAGTRRLALAELADFLRPLPTGAFQRAVAEPPRAQLDPETLNHVAGAIELAAARRGVPAPVWVRSVPAQDQPSFGSTLSSLRLHLLTRSPVALRRRNLFMDASIDERV
jgi:hypothetical protein